MIRHRNPRSYLEPMPVPEPSQWWAAGKVIIVAWLVAHACMDAVIVIRWIAEKP